MSLSARITDDMKEAMKARDSEKLAALRMMRAEILNLEKLGAGEVTEDKIVGALQKMARQRVESIEQFRAGGRDELAAKEESELKIIQDYLPAEASGAEIDAAVREAIASTGATTARDMGKVMGAAVKTLKETGKAVDSAKVNQLVRSLLGG